MKPHKPWVVVENYEHHNQRIVFESTDFDNAENAFYEMYTEDELCELHVAICHRNPDGELSEDY